MKWIIAYLLVTYSLFPDEVEEKVAKLFVIPIGPLMGEELVEDALKLLESKGIGGVLFLEGTKKRQLELIERVGDVLTFQDAEWGVGMRLLDVPPLPKNGEFGEDVDFEALVAHGREIGRQCREVGILGNFAPVVDLLGDHENPVVGMRSFGSDPQRVAMMGCAVVQGMQEMGIWACAKHFPGHGDTEVDSHLGLPVIEKSLDRIWEEELVPFMALIEAGVDMVMVGHLVFPVLSDLPASLSPEVIQGLLQGEMGFSGVVVTDALNMGALMQHFSFQEACEKALLAGADLLISSSAVQEEAEWLIREAIPKAIEQIAEKCRSGEIPLRLIEEKLEKITGCGMHRVCHKNK